MTTDQDRTERERVRDMRRQARADDRQARKMLRLFQKSISRGLGHTTRPSPKKLVRGRAARATRGAGTGKTEAIILKIHDGGRAGDAYSRRAEGAELIDTSMFSNPRDNTLEWDLDCKRHPTVDPRNLFVHVSLSRPEGNDLSQDTWKLLVNSFLNNIGASGVQFTAWKHNNSRHPHAQIIFSRSLPSVRLLSMFQNRWTWRTALRQTECELGLTAIERPVDEPRAQTSDAAVNAQRRAARRGTPSVFVDPKVVEQVLSQATTAEQFATELKALGIEVRHVQKDSKATGILFRRLGAEEWLAGSSIRREFGLPRIQARIQSNQLALQRVEQGQLIKRQREAEERRQREAQQFNVDRDS
jgi:hypothetical protein